MNRWIDKIVAGQLRAVLINQRGKELAFVTTQPISGGKGKHRISGYGFMVGRSSAGMHSDFATARGICERILELKK